MLSRKLTMLASGLLLIATVGGCSKTTGLNATSVTCDVLKPITWSSKDTRLTIKQIKEANAAWKSVCQR